MTPWPWHGRAPAPAGPALRPAAALLGLVLLAAAGAALTPRLVPDRHAPAPAPALRIEAALPGFGAGAVERALTLALEQALAEVPGLQAIEARSFPGRAELLLRFDSARARAAALPAVRGRIVGPARAAGSPRPPAVEAVDTDAVTAAIYRLRAPELSAQVVHWARAVFADPMRTLPGVDSVTVAGPLRREVLIEPDMARMAAFGLAFDDVIAALRAEGDAARAGTGNPASAQAIAATTVRLPNGEPTALSEVAQVAVVDAPAARPRRPADTGMWITVRADSPRAGAEVAERVHAHLAWLEANDLVPAEVSLARLHDEARAMRTWRTRVLARLGTCAALVLAFIGLVYGARLAAVAALGFLVWLPAALAALWLFGFTLDLASAAGLLLASVPFALLILLPRAGTIYLGALAGAAALGAAGALVGAPFARAAGAAAVAAALAGPVRWLLGPWLPFPAPSGPLTRLRAGSAQAVPARTAAWVAALFVLAAAGVSIYALPSVRADVTEGELRLRVRGEDARGLAVVSGWLTTGLHAIPQVVDVASSASLVERWRLRLDAARLAALDIERSEVGRAFAIAQEGLVVGEIVNGDARLPVRLRLAPGAAGAGFERLLLRGARRDQAPVYLRDVGSAERVPQPRALVRLDRAPALEIHARWRGRAARAALRRYCRRLEIPAGYRAACSLNELDP